MGIKITANSKEGFEKIETALKFFKDDFVKKFNVAEENDFNGIIQLSADCNNDDIIYISADKVVQVTSESKTTYEKSNEEYKEIVKHNILIFCEKSNVRFLFMLNNRRSPNIRIEFI